jgi:hypothetical protein
MAQFLSVLAIAALLAPATAAWSQDLTLARTERPINTADPTADAPTKVYVLATCNKLGAIDATSGTFNGDCA